eukprot:6206423-Pleurochrysis_carterae.AAC.1
MVVRPIAVLARMTRYRGSASIHQYYGTHSRWAAHARPLSSLAGLCDSRASWCRKRAERVLEMMEVPTLEKSCRCDGGISMPPFFN